MTTHTPAYWDRVAGEFGRDEPSATWRVYMQQCYAALVTRWMADVPDGPTLKTDLFEEAVTPHHLFGVLGTHAMGMDLSPAVAHGARARLQHERPDRGAPPLVIADARRLPWASDSLARILSGSSLDHFPHREDIATALAELARCLRPGGCLVVTFDNPHNPLVRLRNALPFGWLARLGLVPYYVGATYDRATAIRTLTALGLEVTHVGTMGHAPRAPAIWASDRHARRHRGVSARLLRLFSWCDRFLGDSRVAYRTGYYLALRAVKPAAAVSSPTPTRTPP
jgi:SAM-dependent methyltransferase